jgi:hypothetical protein
MLDGRNGGGGVSEGVWLEDCTGNVLGYLPTDGEEDGEGDGEGEGDTLEDGEGEGGWELEESDISIEENRDGIGFKIVIPPKFGRVLDRGASWRSCWFRIWMYDVYSIYQC